MTEPTTTGPTGAEPATTPATTTPSSTGRSRRSKAPTRLPIYRLVLRSQVTKARLAALLGLGAVGIVVGAALGAAPRTDLALDDGAIVTGHLLRGARFISTFGLSLVVPVTALVFAAASLGDPDEEGTLVYLWLRPVRRARLVLAAAAASFTVAWPVVVIPLAVAAAATRGGSDLVVATVASATVGLVAYTGIFCALGLVTKRSLVWGLLYIFIWEGFVATAADSAAQLAVRTYARSVLESITDVPLRGTFISAPASLLVPVAVAVVALAFATWRLTRRDIA
jgi:ABC-2 type transport system permease protein